MKVLWHFFLFASCYYYGKKSLNCLKFIVYNIAVIDYKQTLDNFVDFSFFSQNNFSGKRAAGPELVIFFGDTRDHMI